MPTDIQSLTRGELELQFKNWGQPAYRVKQLLDWLYVRHAADWDAMTNLPKTSRDKLRETFSLAHPRVGPQARRARHHPKIPLETRRRTICRKRPDSRQPRALRRCQRPSHALHLHPGRLRLRLQILRQRTGRLEAQSCRRTKSSGKSSRWNERFEACQETDVPVSWTTSSSWAWASRWPITTICSRR